VDPGSSSNSYWTYAVNLIRGSGQNETLASGSVNLTDGDAGSGGLLLLVKNYFFLAMIIFK